jgi:hypothetical protein
MQTATVLLALALAARTRYHPRMIPWLNRSQDALLGPTKSA